MKIVVTGAAGRVGRYVIDGLINSGYDVLALTYARWPECPVEQVSLDISDYHQVNAVKDKFADCGGLIHLAAIPGPGKLPDPVILQTNTVGSFNIVDSAAEMGIRKIAIASSDCTLGFMFSKNKPTPEYLPVDEAHPCRPDDSYGLSKVLTEKTADALTQRYPGLSIASLRITMIITPDKYQPGSFFHTMIHSHQKSNNLWSYLDVRDAARAFRMAIESNFQGHQIFFIAARDTWSLLPTAKLVQKYYSEVTCRCSFTEHESLEDTTKAATFLGFKSEYSWRDEF